MTIEQDDQPASPAPTDPPADAGTPPPPESAPETPPIEPESAPDAPTEGNEPASLEDAIRSVIPKEDDAEDGEEPAEGADDQKGEPEEGKPAQEGQDDDDQAADELSDEDKSLKPNTQKRISKLLQQRKEHRERAEALEAEKAELEPLADNMRTIRTFMGETGVTGEDAQTLFRVGALLRSGDYQGFLDTIGPFVEQARIATGQALPTDLQKAVDDGRMDEEDAKRFSMDRANSDRQRAQLEADNAKEKARSQETAKALETNTANTIRDTVNSWVAQRQASDPDFGRKHDAIMDAVKLHVLEKGRPKDQAEAVKVMESVYDTVTKRLAPPPEPVKPTRATPDGMSAAASPATSKEPTDLAGAMKRGLQAARSK